eukprot:gene20816-biopygen15351
MTLHEIITETNADPECQKLGAPIRSQSWQPVDIKYRQVKNELTIGAKNIILQGSRIVIPRSLQQQSIDLAHEGHRGHAKAKSLIREKVWLPKIDEMVKTTIDSCLACQETGKPNPPKPAMMIKTSKHPWETVHTNYFGPLPSGEHLVVVIDDYSRFPEVEILKSTKASILIPKLDQIFAIHGIPEVTKSDNGPSFNGNEFQWYVSALGIKHEPVTLRWPQANGEVERFNQPLAKVLQSSVIEKNNGGKSFSVSFCNAELLHHQ